MAAVRVLSSWLRNAVTSDGKISSSEEWSDATPYDIPLDKVSGWPIRAVVQSDKMLTAWFKNDGGWLYMLYRVAWPSGDVDPNDGAFIELFWGAYSPPWEYSDSSWIFFNQATFDAYGWDDTRWYGDVDASPAGQNNVEGAATHDGTYYWFEFRKMLRSGDGRDWNLNPGETVGSPYAPSESPHLLVGIWDNSIRSTYEQYVSLGLANQPGGRPPPAPTPREMARTK